MGTRTTVICADPTDPVSVYTSAVVARAFAGEPIDEDNLWLASMEQARKAKEARDERRNR